MKINRLFTLIAAVLLCGTLQAQDNITDSVDALHYDLRLDIGNHTARRIEGSTAVTMHVLRQVDSLALELCPSDIDSVLVDGTAAAFSYDAAARMLSRGWMDSVLRIYLPACRPVLISAFAFCFQLTQADDELCAELAKSGFA